MLSLGLYRVLTLSFGISEILLFGGISFGWTSLVFILKQEGYFSHLCPEATRSPTINSTGAPGNTPSQVTVFGQTTPASLGVDEVPLRGFPSCPEQDAQLQLIFTVAIFCYEFFLFPMGLMLDKFGTLFMRMLTSCFLVTSFLLVAFSSRESTNVILPAMCLLTVGGIELLFVNMQISNLFGRKKSTFISLLSGCFGSSAFVFIIFKFGYEQYGITLQTSFFIWAGLSSILCLNTILLPKRGHIPYPLPPDYRKKIPISDLEGVDGTYTFKSEDSRAEDNGRYSSVMEKNKAQLNKDLAIEENTSSDTEHPETVDTTSKVPHTSTEDILLSQIPSPPIENTTSEMPRLATDDTTSSQEPHPATDDTASSHKPHPATEDATSPHMPHPATDDTASTQEPHPATDDTASSHKQHRATDDTATSQQPHPATNETRSSQQEPLPAIDDTATSQEPNPTTDDTKSSERPHLATSEKPNPSIEDIEAPVSQASLKNGANRGQVASQATTDTSTDHRTQQATETKLNETTSEEMDSKSSQDMDLSITEVTSCAQSVTEAMKKLRYPSLRSCLLSLPTLFLLIWFSLLQLNMFFFLGTLNPDLERLTNNDQSLVSQYTTALAFIQVSGVFIAPLCGLLLDRNRTKKRMAGGKRGPYQDLLDSCIVYALTTFMYIAFNATMLVTVIEVRYASFLLHAFSRGFMYSLVVTGCALFFPIQYYGSTTGLVQSLASLVGLIQRPLFTLLQNRLNNDPFWIYIGLIVLNVITFFFPIYIYIYAKNSSKWAVKLQDSAKKELTLTDM
ncbi:equilibrative nucleobase transporter 1-like [Asterias amurensis]|uniref:equilibrative nucleobase transporter 1-like n=1 Tax=Asterias amurensis TaxID=7602 RepID=UPI003AB599D4